ncbi:MAG: CpsD/CapB family tyrosine-protein kinase [Oscillospiraceae bacterium]|nr:CpsD/CapB family tyrosine-protein kinase [Oscillospiraceae bacterium]
MAKIIASHLVAKEFQVSEAIKALRTNVLFSGANIRAVGLTSYTTVEGKSTISFQLAASLAQAGKQVLLVDADLRKSLLASRLRVFEKVDGLSHFLSGQANVNELLNETDIPGLYIMFAGKRVPNASELLGSESFAKLIPALKDAFDYVIVDAAPVGQVIDCAVIAPVLDGIIMVIDATQNSYKMEVLVKRQLEMTGAKILGAVLNRVTLQNNHRYYGRAYGITHGYGENK